MHFSTLIAAVALALLAGCGALEPKYFPDKKTITSTLFPTTGEEQQNPEVEARIEALFTSGVEPSTEKERPRNSLLPPTSRVLIVSSLTGIDTALIDHFSKQITATEKGRSVESIMVSSLPNLHTIRIMGARQKAQYVLILNSFSNVYRYHNAMTIPTVLGIGIPYFFLETQTIRVFAKVEYSLIDIRNNIILSNESVTTEVQGKAILPESGIVQYQLENQAISSGVEALIEKFLTKI